MDDLSKSYHTLGLKPGASMDEIKQAYRDLVRVWHPDRFGHDERLRLIAQDKLKEINGAYEFLQAHAFEAAPTPETSIATAPGESESAVEAESSEPPVVARGRTALWVTAGALTVALLAVAAILLTAKNRTKTATDPGNVVSSVPANTTSFALGFNRDQGHLAIATTGSLTGTYTIELWVLTRRPRQTQTIVSTRGPVDYGFNIKFRQGKRFHADIGDGSRWLIKDANATYAYRADTWYHLAYVVTPTNYAAYVNGELTVERSIYPPGNPMLYDDQHQLRFGMDQLVAADDLDGSLAEIRIWKTPRTKAELVANQGKALAGTEPGLQGYWRFAHDAGRATPDLSGHGFTGTLMSNTVLNKDGPPMASR